MINIDEILNDEKYNLELKREVDFEEPKKYLKSVSAFSNGYDVGFIIFGIEDGTKNIVGIKNVQKSVEEVTKRIKDKIEPSIIPEIDVVNYKQKQLIVVKVIQGANTPYYYVNKGTKTAYLRRGNESDPVNSIELNELILRGQNKGWDQQITDNNYKDYSFNALIDEFKEVKNIDLSKRDLVSFDLINKEDKLTNAAVLFSDQNNFIGSFISCTRWDGLEKIDAKDDVEYHGSIILQIKSAIEFIKKHMSNGWTRVGEIRRKNIPEYDLNAIREAVINAEAHRQYIFQGAQIELSMYDDRIEIISFGGIDFGYTLEELLSEHYSTRRNPLICDIFSRLDYMERRGSGIQKIYEAYEKDTKKPHFEILRNNIFRVTFYSRLYKDTQKNVDESVALNDENVAKNVALNDENVALKIKQKYPELKKIYTDIIKAIYNDNYITQEEIAVKLNKTRNSVYRNIKILKDMKILERIGTKKIGYWKVNL